MGFIRVIFCEIRNVVIDDVDSNQQTGDIIEVEAGLHTITMSGPVDFWPTSKNVMVVHGSGPLSDQEVCFEKN